MGRIDQKHYIPSHLMAGVYRASLNLGARQPVLLDEAGLCEPAMRHPKNTFAVEKIVQLCDAASRELGNKDATLKIGANMVPHGFSDSGYSAIFEKDFLAAIDRMLRALGLGDQQAPLKWDRSDSHARLVWDIRLQEYGCLIQLVSAAICAHGEVVTNGRQAIKGLYFACPEPEGFDGFAIGDEQQTKIPCFFDQNLSYIEYGPHSLKLTNPQHNVMVLKAKSAQRARACSHDVGGQYFTKLTYDYLWRLLDKTGLNLDAASESFSMAERTMRRKLVAEGTTFRRILEGVRQDVCQLYFLEGQRSLSSISAKLGYSELSALTRAYTSWHGHPPSRDLSAQLKMAA